MQYKGKGPAELINSGGRGGGGGFGDDSDDDDDDDDEAENGEPLGLGHYEIDENTRVPLSDPILSGLSAAGAASDAHGFLSSLLAAQQAGDAQAGAFVEAAAQQLDADEMVKLEVFLQAPPKEPGTA